MKKNKIKIIEPCPLRGFGVRDVESQVYFTAGVTNLFDTESYFMGHMKGNKLYNSRVL